MTTENGLHSDETPTSDPLRLTITEPARSEKTLSGLIECGGLSTGDGILISPSNQTAVVVALTDWVSGATMDRAGAGRQVAVSLDRAATAEPGISAPYEAPTSCELVIDTDRLSIAQSIDRISSYVRREFPLTKS